MAPGGGAARRACTCGARADSTAAARSARHRSHGNTHRCAAVRARRQARRIRGAQGRADRGIDPADDRTRRHRAVRYSPGRILETRPKGVDDGAILIVAKDDRARAHRSAVRSRRRAHRCYANRIVDETIAPLFKQADIPAASTPGSTRCSRSSMASRCRRRIAAGKPRAPGARCRYFWLRLLVVAAILRNIIGRAPSALIAGLLGAGAAWCASRRHAHRSAQRRWAIHPRARDELWRRLGRWRPRRPRVSRWLASAAALVEVLEDGGGGGWSGGGGRCGGGGASGRW